MKKLVYLLIVIISFTLITGCKDEIEVFNVDITAANDKLDDNGCAYNEGYYWCEVKNKCVRLLQESCPEAIDSKGANKLAMSHVKYQLLKKGVKDYQLHEVKVDEMPCSYCYDVTLFLDIDEERGHVRTVIRQGKVKDVLYMNSIKDSLIQKLFAKAD